MIPVLVNFARYNFAELFTHHLRKHTPLLCDYLNLCHELLLAGSLHLSSGPLTRHDLMTTGVLDHWIDLCLSKGDTNAAGGIDSTKNDRIAAVCFLSTLWSLYPEKFDKHIENNDDTRHGRTFMHLRHTQNSGEPQTLGQVSLTMLKRNCRDKNYVLRLTSISHLFRLLD